MKKLIVVFSNVAIAPENQALYKVIECFHLKGIGTFVIYHVFIRDGLIDYMER
jgi:hypothetical protein